MKIWPTGIAMPHKSPKPLLHKALRGVDESKFSLNLPSKTFVNSSVMRATLQYMKSLHFKNEL